MRLDVSTYGLFACLLGGVDAVAMNELLGTRTTNAPNSVVNFKVAQTPFVFLNTKDTSINWNVTDGNNVVEAKLYRIENHQALATAFPTSLSNEAPTPGFGPDLMRLMATEVDKRLDLPLTTNFPGSGSVVLKINSLADEYRDAQALNTTLFLQLRWLSEKDANIQGLSYSPVFAIITDNKDRTALGAEIEDVVLGQSPAYPESSAPATALSTTPAALITTGTTSTAPATATPSSNAPTDIRRSGDDGLPMDAKIGIGIGCGIAGLLIIAAIMYFTFFRRRRNPKRMSMHTGYASDTVGRGIMVDKEIPAINESSPHSAYAEDGGHLHDPSRRSMVAGVHDGDHQDNAVYAPYTDRAPSPPATAGAATVGPISSQTDLHQTGTRSPTSPITSRYAHLVEEGMTEDEIRRLEEEERQLDAAIESAGRSSRRDL